MRSTFSDKFGFLGVLFFDRTLAKDFLLAIFGNLLLADVFGCLIMELCLSLQMKEGVGLRATLLLTRLETLYLFGMVLELLQPSMDLFIVPFSRAPFFAALREFKGQGAELRDALELICLARTDELDQFFIAINCANVALTLSC